MTCIRNVDFKSVSTWTFPQCATPETKQTLFYIWYMFIHQSDSTKYYSSLSQIWYKTKNITSSSYLVKTDIDDIRPKVTHPDLTSLTRVIPLQTPNFPSTINDSTILLKWGDICILLVSQFLLWFSRLKKHTRNLKSRFFLE